VKIGTDSKIHGKDNSQKETNLLEESYQVKIQKWCSTTTPDSDQENKETTTNIEVTTTFVNKVEVRHQEKDQTGGVVSNIQKKEESIKPRSNGDKNDTSKRTINTSNYAQRTAVFDSSLTGATDYIMTPSGQGNTNNQLVNEIPGLKTILEEDLYNSEYHSIDPEVATVHKMDKGEITAHVRVDEECQTMESTTVKNLIAK